MPLSRGDQALYVGPGYARSACGGLYGYQNLRNDMGCSPFCRPRPGLKGHGPPSYEHSSWRLQQHRVRCRCTITCGVQFSPDSALNDRQFPRPYSQVTGVGAPPRGKRCAGSRALARNFDTSLRYSSLNLWQPADRVVAAN
jgi:hypothetical protein